MYVCVRDKKGGKMSGIVGGLANNLPTISGFAPLPSAAAMGFMTAQGMMSGLMFGFAYKMGTRFADSFDDEDMKSFRDNPNLAIQLLTPHIKEIETWLMTWTNRSADQIQHMVMEKSLDLEKLKAEYNFRLLGTLPKQYLDMFLKGIIPNYDGGSFYDPNSDKSKFTPTNPDGSLKPGVGNSPNQTPVKTPKRNPIDNIGSIPLKDLPGVPKTGPVVTPTPTKTTVQIDKSYTIKYSWNIKYPTSVTADARGNLPTAIKESTATVVGTFKMLRENLDAFNQQLMYYQSQKASQGTKQYFMKMLVIENLGNQVTAYKKKVKEVTGLGL